MKTSPLMTFTLSSLILFTACKPEPDDPAAIAAKMEMVYQQMPSLNSLPADPQQKHELLQDAFAKSDLYYEGGEIKLAKADGQIAGEKALVSLTIAGQIYNKVQGDVGIRDNAKVLVFQDAQHDIVVFENPLSPTARGTSAVTVYADKRNGEIAMVLEGYPK